MLRPVEDIQVQSRQAAEDRVMRWIDNASQIDCATEVWVNNNNLPDWLILKLKQTGYSVHKDHPSSMISWGYGDA